MTAPTVADTEADAAGARQDVERAERDLATGARNVGVSALHKLRDAWRHADLSAQGARERAERDRQAARLKGLAEIGAEVGRLAAGTDLDGLGQALADVATAAGRARAIAAAHDAAVADLIAAAADLGAEPIAPGGPRATSAGVAVRGEAIVHDRAQVGPIGAQLATALAHALAGDAAGGLARVAAVTQLPEPRRPDYIARGRGGLLIPVIGELSPQQQAQVRSGDLVLLDEPSIDAFMRGELA
jgi:hypothetical protein